MMPATVLARLAPSKTARPPIPMSSCSGKLVPRNISQRTMRNSSGIILATEETEAEKFVSASSLRSQKAQSRRSPFWRDAKTNTRDACATQREMHSHPRLVRRFARCVLRKWRRYCPGAIFSARWNTVRIELTFPNPHSPAIVSMLF